MWVRDQAARFLEQYFRESLGSRHPALTILRRLSAQVLYWQLMCNSAISSLHQQWPLAGWPPGKEAARRRALPSRDPVHSHGKWYFTIWGLTHTQWKLEEFSFQLFKIYIHIFNSTLSGDSVWSGSFTTCLPHKVTITDTKRWGRCFNLLGNCKTGRLYCKPASSS